VCIQTAGLAKMGDASLAYFDNANSTKVDESIIEAMIPTVERLRKFNPLRDGDYPVNSGN
jgi:hypothetical protein